jgi:hypothetical protein
MEYLGLHNKPKAEVHPRHKLTGPKEEEEEDYWYVCEKSIKEMSSVTFQHLVIQKLQS